MNPKHINLQIVKHALLVAALFSCFVLVNVIFWYVHCDSNIFLLLGLLASILLGIIVYVYQIGLLDNAQANNVFLATLIISCVIFVFMFPPRSIPDERHHFLSSYWLADCITGESSLFDSSNIPLRENDYQLCEVWSSNDINFQSYKSILDHFELFNQSNQMQTVHTEQFSIGSENLVTKIGSVLGILIARLLNLGAYPLFYLGRLLNACEFILLSYSAFRIIPMGKTIVAGISILPMTLHLAASYSYDGGIIGLSLLLIALLLKAITNNQPISVKEMSAICFITALLAPCKIVYASIALLLFLIPGSRFKKTSSKYAYIGIVFALACISIIGFRLTGITALASSSTGLDFRGAESGHFYTIKSILDNPFGTIAIFFRTLILNGDYFASTLVGGSLGWLQSTIAAPHFIVFLYYLLLIIGAQKSEDDNVDIPLPMKFVMGLIFALCVFGTMLSMFLGWTFDFEPIVMGVQGRYFLPVLTVALLVFRWKSIFISQHTYGFTITGISLLNIIYGIGLVGSALALV
ncbi:DUF2142 domain-containing protein [Collinsella intestinalis]|uniref:DUF2142 domain-containing protein n=1 Tax=Collinsella intestinalis TaxID=147207 RepID=UPI0025A42C5F|nr:DUF2142 domain-containing protein [Collinsella intestinalis]MDM8164164.1 DUF2142 domain-containing protein [Collinsella intestinalis]